MPFFKFFQTSLNTAKVASSVSRYNFEYEFNSHPLKYFGCFLLVFLFFYFILKCSEITMCYYFIGSLSE